MTCRDHPRVCGEHDCVPEDLPLDSGSSPRMRGTRNATSPQFQVRRIIPAYAGNTQCANLDTTDPRDHPRVCGEHRTCAAPLPLAKGSSPRMRGTPGTGHHVRHYAGIIPAYAGNTAPTPPARTTRRDHPRVCGEHVIPHLRRAGRTGIIPAYAGNTYSTVNVHVAEWDHPRVCGEHLFDGERACCGMGSSPRMRGTPIRR